MADKALIDQLRRRIDEIGVHSPEESVRRAGGPTSSARGPAQIKAAVGADFDQDEDKAFRKIVALVNISDRSEHALRERLDRDGFAEEDVDEAIARAKSYGFIDDERFGALLVRSRLSQGKGVAGIDRELRNHGIELEALPGWPEEFEYDEGAEIDRALVMLEKRPPHSNNLRDGAYRRLMGKGFSSSVASSAARIWVESR